jgi:hypothetical protein
MGYGAPMAGQSFLRPSDDIFLMTATELAGLKRPLTLVALGLDPRECLEDRADDLRRGGGG